MKRPGSWIDVWRGKQTTRPDAHYLPTSGTTMMMAIRYQYSLLICLALCSSVYAQSNTANPPNIIVVFADDLGYGDLGVYGHPTIRTPNLDRMASEGVRFTQFYAAASVCTPSRAALLTGRYPIRSGMASDHRRVLFPDSKLGLPHEEVTIAEALRAAGYATAAVGKWHLGHMPDYLPANHGFDYYYGIPYSNDMDRVVEGEWQDPFWDPKPEYWNVPIMRNEKIVERPADQYTLTKRYTEEAVRFIEEHRDDPFFLYLAHSMPHVPLFASQEFRGISRRGLYGDVIEEIDWSVGRILETLKELRIERNTLVVFTSDNGPWHVFRTHGGSAGLLRGAKGMTWEGGMRVPAIVWWPGSLPAGRIVMDVASTMDIFPTALDLADALLPSDRLVDGKSLIPLLTVPTDDPLHESFFFYRGQRLYAVRKGPWKAHLVTQGAYPDGDPHVHPTPQLYHLDHDPSEKYDVADQHPDVVAAIRSEIERHQATIDEVESRLDARISDQ